VEGEEEVIESVLQPRQLAVDQAAQGDGVGVRTKPGAACAVLLTDTKEVEGQASLRLVPATRGLECVAEPAPIRGEPFHALFRPAQGPCHAFTIRWETPCQLMDMVHPIVVPGVRSPLYQREVAECSRAGVACRPRKPIPKLADYFQVPARVLAANL
jgi:hypothetical protein